VASPYIERILKARVYDVATESQLDHAARLSRRLGNTILLKREDLQEVFSFKLRGSFNKISQLDDATAKRGVICASAGNHAQGVALAARNSANEAAAKESVGRARQYFSTQYNACLRFESARMLFARL